MLVEDVFVQGIIAVTNEAIVLLVRRRPPRYVRLLFHVSSSHSFLIIMNSFQTSTTTTEPTTTRETGTATSVATTTSVRLSALLIHAYPSSFLSHNFPSCMLNFQSTTTTAGNGNDTQPTPTECRDNGSCRDNEVWSAVTCQCERSSAPTSSPTTQTRTVCVPVVGQDGTTPTASPNRASRQSDFSKGTNYVSEGSTRRSTGRRHLRSPITSKSTTSKSSGGETTVPPTTGPDVGGDTRVICHDEILVCAPAVGDDVNVSKGSTSKSSSRSTLFGRRKRRRLGRM